MEYRRSGFRARPIDVDKPMPILHEEIDDDFVRNVSEIKSGMEEIEEQEIHFQEALKLFNTKKSNNASIPIPRVEVVQGYDEEQTEPFQPPQSSYIRYQEPFHQVEYDMQDDDFDFHEQLTTLGYNFTEDDYEWIIDRFEITTGFNNEIIDLQYALQSVKDSSKTQFDEQMITKMYHFWSQKRKKYGKSLYTKFQPIPKMDDPNPYCAFRPREAKKVRKNQRNNQTLVLKLMKIKKDLESVKEILSLVKDREAIKKQKIAAKKEMHLDIIEKAKDQVFQEKETTIQESVSQKEQDELMQDSSEENELIESYFEISSSEDEEEEEQTYYEKFHPRILKHFNKDAPLTQTIYEFTSGSLKDENDVDIPTFVGRARYGRNGRLLFDRIIDEKTTKTNNTQIHYNNQDSSDFNANKIKQFKPISKSLTNKDQKNQTDFLIEDYDFELENILDELNEK